MCVLDEVMTPNFGNQTESQPNINFMFELKSDRIIQFQY